MAKRIVNFEDIMAAIGQRSKEEYVEECMSLSPAKVKKIPLRYRLITLGFVKKMSLDELNELLLSKGCEKLYARSFKEATLIYAFAKGLSYQEWRTLLEVLEENEIHPLESKYFNIKGDGIDFAELKRYVANNSILMEDGGEYKTQHVTLYLEDAILKLPKEQKAFLAFVVENIEQFGQVREKVRYYFCKYLLYYLERRIDSYVKARKVHLSADQQDDFLDEMIEFSRIGELEKNHTEDEIRDILSGSKISCYGIYEALRYFYFDYVSMDWVEWVLRDYKNSSEIPEEKARELAVAIRRYRNFSKMSDKEVLDTVINEVPSLESRTGEDSIRKYVKGTLDIDRETLVCYLLFFGADIRSPEDQLITPERIDEILTECHMAPLDDDRDFDYFVLNFFNAENRATYLDETVKFYAVNEQNSFLYHMFSRGVSNENKLNELLEVK